MVIHSWPSCSERVEPNSRLERAEYLPQTSEHPNLTIEGVFDGKALVAASQGDR